MRILLTIAATLAFLATASAQNTATDKAATDKAPAEKAAAVAPEAGGTTLQPAGEQKAHSCAGKADAKAGCCAGKADAKACAGHDQKAHGQAHGEHGAHGDAKAAGCAGATKSCCAGKAGAKTDAKPAPADK